MAVPWDPRARRDLQDTPVLPVHLPQVGSLLRKVSHFEQDVLSWERRFQERLIGVADLTVGGATA